MNSDEIEAATRTITTRYEFFTAPTKTGGTKRPYLLTRAKPGRHGSYSRDYDYGEWLVKRDMYLMYPSVRTAEVSKVLSNVRRQAKLIEPD